MGGLQVLCRQHPQTWRQEDYLAGEDTQLAFTTLLGRCASREANDANDVTTLDVLVLLLERCIGLGLLQLAHDLYRNAFCLAYTLLASAIDRES